jgi:excisionase family DNA binding protein
MLQAPNNNEQLLTVSRAARLLEVASETVRAMADTGRLPAVRTTSGVRLFNRHDVEALAAEREAHGKGRRR